MSGFKMDDYVDVAERIRHFAERFPEGSLQSELNYTGEGWLCKAYAYRTPEDPRPGIGHAFEPVPGKTPYTKDSECMNAETSAWGRAIVALGFETKKIASAQEVQARQEAPRVGADTGSSGRGGERPSPSSPAHPPATPATDGVFRFPSGKHAGKTIEEAGASYCAWYLESGPRDDVKAAILAHTGQPDPNALPDDLNLPF